MSNKKQFICIGCYVFCILYITLLSRTPALVHVVRMIPFWSFSDWIKGNWSRGGSIILNMILFVPFGYILSGTIKKRLVQLATCFALSLAIEIAQYCTFRGFFDIDDIITNTFGGFIGIVCYQRFGDRLKNWHVPVIFILAGIAGCFLVTSNTVIYETQFDFHIQYVKVKDNKITMNGTCDIYRRGFLPYQIQLKGENGIIHAATTTEGMQFTATAEVSAGEYEVDVVFNGYQPISTKTYINGNQIEYVQAAPTPDITDTDLEFLLDTGILKVYNAEYDVYVYQVENRLYWIIGKTDFNTSVIYHLYTEEPENLPVERQQYGFDNRGFSIGSDKDLTGTINCGRYRVYSDIIPTDYSITAIAVGMNKGSDIIWKECFRADTF